MGNGIAKDVPEARYLWTYRSKGHITDTTPIVSGDGSTVALYLRGQRKIIVLDRNGSTVASLPVKQKFIAGNVSAIPSLSHDGSKICVRDSNSVIVWTRQGAKLWEYERKDKMVRSGAQSWIAQISADGKLVVVRQFLELLLLDGNTGAVLTVFPSEHQMAESIPRISEDGSVIVYADGLALVGVVNKQIGWSKVSPGTNVLRSRNWGDAALSADGSVCAAVADDVCYVFNARNGQPLASIPNVRHRDHENSCEPAFSHDGKRIALVLHKDSIAVLGGPNYSQVLLNYYHKGPHRPVAPLLSRDGRVLAAKAGDGIMLWNVPDKPQPNPAPFAAARVRDDSHIPGGPTYHSDKAHHDRDTHHKRTFTASNDGTLCVAVARHKELWAFSLQEHIGQGGVIVDAVPVAVAVGGGGSGKAEEEPEKMKSEK